MSTRAVLVLGHQLFDPSLMSSWCQTSTPIFMREDLSLCTHFRYHKHKIQFFLSAMRKYKLELETSGHRCLHYEELDLTSGTYEEALIRFLKANKSKEIHSFEIEDKFFELRVKTLCQNEGVSLHIHESPMFLTTRPHFEKYLKSTKRPFMKSFYESQRKRLGILVDKSGEPNGGRWSFDEDNRKALSKPYTASALPVPLLDRIDAQVAEIVDTNFSEHPGDTKTFWLPTDRSQARSWLTRFLEDRFKDFGPYEDALSPKWDFLNHSVLTPFLNTGLLTPREVIDASLEASLRLSIPINSTEGFVRQVIGWREFVRGIYQNFSEKQDTSNFWKHTRRLSPCWYEGNSGVAPLDDVIHKVLRYGYAHHIERLMVVGSLMLLLEVDPKESHRWFMEMFVDSSDWVMGPNVYGMALFSDGGIFATKPYICGSNYYKKMGGYPDGEWCAGVDGLYWRFIDKHRSFFLKNPRLAMMVRSFDKMDAKKKLRIFNAAEKLQTQLTMP